MPCVVGVSCAGPRCLVSGKLLTQKPGESRYSEVTTWTPWSTTRPVLPVVHSFTRERSRTCWSRQGEDVQLVAMWKRVDHLVDPRTHESLLRTAESGRLCALSLVCTGGFSHIKAQQALQWHLNWLDRCAVGFAVKPGRTG